MTPITSLKLLSEHLASQGRRWRIAVVWGTDHSTLAAVTRAVECGFAEAIFVGAALPPSDQSLRSALSGHVSHVTASDATQAARLAVELIRDGKADILMKGLVGTDVLLRAVLDKETGLLPAGRVLTHMAVTEWPEYGKLLFFTDAAVIPYPTRKQREAQVDYAARLCRAFGVARPRIALIHCSEKASEKFPYTLEYACMAAEAREGRWGDIVLDGPLDVRTSCDAVALHVKGIGSPLEGRADALVFPDIEAGNTFYKCMTYFAHAATAGMLCGTSAPVVLPSRGDSAETKFHSLAMAAITVDHPAEDGQETL
ncbi:phosphate acetyltransferase [Bacteroidaceae bacterium]|jgi:phosphate butyryltransferase|uniref:phosphate acyltransferase n=1 Tax=Prevotella sp. MGM2 TaxID=2033406 RepID=UPI000CE9C500|nr:phosphate acyltransferase [Prevotella sp. MGM2]GAY30966.1 phosphate acetyl/butyryltransferase [Prevotella sp. MGM2]GFI35713.1 phosphate acetyltransferase [Bacteroidaceae bacterium]